jgi:hypothetical protein
VGAVIIDTTPPRVQSVTLDRRAGEILITFLDSAAGLDPDGLLSASSYAVFLTAHRGSRLQAISSVLDLGPTAKPGTRRVALLLNGGRRLVSGRYVLTIRSSQIQDLAGLALDGEFRRRMPSGNGSPGGDFVATLSSNGRLRPLSRGPRRTRARHVLSELPRWEHALMHRAGPQHQRRGLRGLYSVQDSATQAFGFSVKNP